MGDLPRTHFNPFLIPTLIACTYTICLHAFRASWGGMLRQDEIAEKWAHNPHRLLFSPFCLHGAASGPTVSDFLAYLERCPSGRRSNIGNVVYPQGYRGFESRPLRE